MVSPGAHHPASVAVEVARRNHSLARAARTDFAELGAAAPEITARLYVALVAEAALMELEHGHPADEVRRAVADLVSPLTG